MASSVWSILSTLIVFLLFEKSSATDGGPIVDVHEILPEYGLPKGLVPDNVESYSLAGDGTFTVDLRSHCYVHFGDHLVYYGTHIEGKLSQGKVTEAKGIQAKKLFAWLPITGIVAHYDDRTVEFQVGFLSETLSVSLFENIPVCKSKLAQSV